MRLPSHIQGRAECIGLVDKLGSFLGLVPHVESSGGYNIIDSLLIMWNALQFVMYSVLKTGYPELDEEISQLFLWS